MKTKSNRGVNSHIQSMAWKDLYPVSQSDKHHEEHKFLHYSTLYLAYITFLHIQNS